MSGAAEPEIGDAEAIIQAAQHTTNGTVYSLVEFNRDRYRTIRVAEAPGRCTRARGR